MLTITLTPTMLTFKDLTEEQANALHEPLELKWSRKGYYYMKGTPEQLYKTLLNLTYTYDIELT